MRGFRNRRVSHLGISEGTGLGSIVNQSRALMLERDIAVRQGPAIPAARRPNHCNHSWYPFPGRAGV